MASLFGMYNYKRAAKKEWRYPGTPIPYRLQGKYEVKK